MLGIITEALKTVEREAYIWIAGLIILACINPYCGSHFTICPFHNLGFKYCPGCGLGHSISYLFHGDIRSSVECHILGIPATAVLLHRIIYLIRKPYLKNTRKLTERI